MTFRKKEKRKRKKISWIPETTPIAKVSTNPGLLSCFISSIASLLFTKSIFPEDSFKTLPFLPLPGEIISTKAFSKTSIL
jgi:hypothetical protein